jgi:hypothetical protein
VTRRAAQRPGWSGPLQCSLVRGIEGRGARSHSPPFREMGKSRHIMPRRRRSALQCSAVHSAPLYPADSASLRVIVFGLCLQADRREHFVAAGLRFYSACDGRCRPPLPPGQTMHSVSPPHSVVEQGLCLRHCMACNAILWSAAKLHSMVQVTLDKMEHYMELWST